MPTPGFPLIRIVCMVAAGLLALLGLIAAGQSHDLGMTVFGSGLAFFGLAYGFWTLSRGLETLYGGGR